MTRNNVGSVASTSRNQLNDTPTQKDESGEESFTPPSRINRPKEKEIGLGYITLEEVKAEAAWKPPRDSKNS